MFYGESDFRVYSSDGGIEKLELNQFYFVQICKFVSPRIFPFLLLKIIILEFIGEGFLYQWVKNMARFPLLYNVHASWVNWIKGLYLLFTFWTSRTWVLCTVNSGIEARVFYLIFKLSRKSFIRAFTSFCINKSSNFHNF